MSLFPLAAQSAVVEGEEPFSNERLVNFYRRSWPGPAKSQGLLKRTAGLTSFADLGSSQPVRAMRLVAGTLYACSNGRLYSVSSAGVVTNLAAITDAVNTTMASNGADEVGIAAGGTFYVWDGAINTVSMNALTSVQQITSDGQYMILADTATDRMQITDINDAKTLGASNFSSADARPDGMVGILWLSSYLYAFGARTVEIWRNVGASNFPFQRVTGTTIECGCFAPKSIAVSGNSALFVGRPKNAGLGVFRIDGNSMARISSPALDRVLQNYSSGDDIVGGAWGEGAESFYRVRFPDRATWTCDLGSRLWHERSSHQTDDTEPWLGVSTETAFGYELVGGSDGVIYRVDETAFKDGATTVQRIAQPPPLINGGQESTLDALYVDAKCGETDIGREAQIALQLSEDGRTWSVELWRSVGAQSQRNTRIRWNGLGQRYEHHARLKVTDPVDVSLYGGDFTLS